MPCSFFGGAMPSHPYSSTKWWPDKPIAEELPGFLDGLVLFEKKTRYWKIKRIFILTGAHIYITCFFRFQGWQKKQNTSHQQLIMIWRFMFPPIMGPPDGKRDPYYSHTTPIRIPIYIPKNFQVWWDYFLYARLLVCLDLEGVFVADGWGSREVSEGDFRSWDISSYPMTHPWDERYIYLLIYLQESTKRR